jgi:hypothetical protein
LQFAMSSTPTHKHDTADLDPTKGRGSYHHLWFRKLQTAS